MRHPIKVFLDDEVKEGGLPEGEGWGHVTTVNDLISILFDKRTEVVEISLDHDLGTEPITGMDFLRWCLRQSEQNPKLFNEILPPEVSIRVHSLNPVAAPQMQHKVELLKQLQLQLQ